MYITYHPLASGHVGSRQLYPLVFEQAFHKGGSPSIFWQEKRAADLAALDRRIIPELLTLCDEIINGNTAGDTQYIPPFLHLAPDIAKSVKAQIRSVLIKIAMKNQFGGSRPVEHRKEGFLASVKYNANKI